MKKITQSFLTLLLLMVAGVAYGQKPTEVADLSKDMYHAWIGVEADATIAETDNPSCGVNLDVETDCPYGNTGVPKDQFADLSDWDYLTLVVTSDNPRLFFNDSSEGGGRITVATKNDPETYLENKGDGVYVIDLAAIKADRGFVHLNAIKASAWNTKSVVAEMKVAKGAPYIPVKPEVADLTKEMFHAWTGVEADAAIADPDEPSCGVNLGVETDCPYGNTGVPKEQFADLSEWDYLTLVVTSDNPRLFFNDSSVDGGRITVATKNDPETYLENKGDGVYVIDLAAIKADRGFVHLNAIKASAWNTKSVVAEMKVATVEPYIPVIATKYAITIAAAENGTVKADVEKAAEGDKVTLTITPAEGYELDQLSVAAGETVVEVAEDNTFTMPAAEVTVTATFKATAGEPGDEPGDEPGEEPEQEPVSNQDLTKDLFHKWTGFDADATIADPDDNSGAYVVDEATGCPYGDTNVSELQFADLSAWDYLTLVVTSDAPRLFFNAKSQSDRISVLPNDETYLISKEDGVYVYDLAAIKEAAGYVHLNAIKASAWNTQITVSEMKLTLAEPEQEIADLMIEDFHLWTGFEAEAAIADPDEANGSYAVNEATGCPYGDSNVSEMKYADLSEWDYLTLVVTSDAPRLFFNAKSQSDRISVLPNDETYLISKEDGVYVYDLAAIREAAGYVHLNSIKASAWNTQITVSEMKLATVEPYKPEAEPEPATFAITIAATENGTVAADVEEAAEGDKVTLTITPAEGYELDQLSVAAGETAVEVAADNTFTMPAAEVTVTATFKATAEEPEPIEYTLDNIFKNTELLKEVTSIDDLKAAPFLLKGEDGLMPYTPGVAPDKWDIYVEEPVTVLAAQTNGGYFEMEAIELADVEGDNYLVKVLNIDKTHRTTPGWAGGLAYLNTQPEGVNEIIFGLNGKNDQHGQDAANHAVWTVSYEEGKGFAFHNVGRDIYLGHDGKQARPVAEAYYWKAYNDFSAGYDKGETEGVGDLAAAAVRTADAKKALEDAKAAYEADNDLNKYGDAVNAAVNAIKACEAVAADYQDLDATGKAEADKVAASYEAGEYADLNALRAAYRAAAKAQTTAGANMTGAIINPSFEWGSNEGWTSTNGGGFATNKNFSKLTGDIFVERWTQAPNTLSDGTFLQTITGLPKGKYTLTAEMQNLEQGNENADGTGYFLVANDAAAEVTTAGETVSVDAFVGEDGELIIGTKLEGCSGNWVCVDNFCLTLVEPNAEPEPDAIEGVAEGAAVKDGKYFENGQIVIVKNGVKYNVAGQIID
ncbi:MAG: hypothetical protein J5888_06505 [Bacteroidaceae bacterium]|nr:hypothetical protein [Bacteroidaceae bacterium]